MASKSAPSFIREVRDERGKEFETVTFECQYSGTPMPDVVWYRDNQVVKNTSNVKIRIKDKKTTLTINRVTQEDEGTYICKATNELGTISSKGHLYVTALTESERLEVEAKKIPKEKEKPVKKKKEIVQDQVEKQVEEVVKKTHLEKQRKVEEEQQVTQEITQSVTQRTVQQVTQEVTQQEVIEAKTVTQQVTQEVIQRSVPEVQEEEQVVEEVTKKTRREKRRKPAPLHEAIPVVVPSEEVEEVTPSLPKMVRPTLSQDLVENAYVEEVMQWVAAKEFGPGESPLRDLARIGFLTRHGTSVSEVTSMYETGEFPALRTPEAQIAMVQVVERSGHGAVISEVLSEESATDTAVEEMGFRAFMRMAEQHQVNVEEVIFSFQPEDFRIQAWETTEEGELHTAEASEVHVKDD